MRLLIRHLREGRATSLLIALLVAVTVLVVAIAPRLLLRLGTDELTSELRAQPAARIDLTGAGSPGFGPGGDLSGILGPIDSIVSDLPSTLPHPLADGAGEAHWVLRTLVVAAPAPANPVVVLLLRLGIDLDADDAVRFTAGEAPEAWAGTDGVADGAAPPPIPIALSDASAQAMDVGVGDLISADPVPYRVAGIYVPVNADDPPWQHERDLLEPQFIREANSPLKIQATALVAPDSIVTLRDAFAEGELSAWVPIDASAYHYADARELGRQVRGFTTAPVKMPDGGTIGFRSSFDDVLNDTRARVESISALIALSASGFLGVLIAAYALCVQAIIARRRTVLALASARGAAPAQVRLVMVVEALLIVVPASAIALAGAALAVPEDVGVAGWVVPASVALIPVLLAGVMSRVAAGREDRADLGQRWTGTSRWVVEVAVLALAGVALYLLQRRGLVESSAAVGIDPLLSAMPVLLAVAAGLAVLRVYPLPLTALTRALRRRTAPAASVGSARAVREPAIGLIGTLALVTGISIAVFSTVMISTVSNGLRQSAADQVGADVSIAAHDLPATLVAEVSDLPQIGTAVALVGASGVEFADEAGPSEINVLMADTAALHRVRPDIPQLGAKVDGAVPILISSDWIDRVAGTDLSLVNSKVREQGVIPFNALPGVTRHWILVDISAAAELGLSGQVPDRVLASLRGDADSASAVAAVTEVVTAAQPEGFEQTVRVDDATSLLAELRASPITGGLERSLLIVSIGTLILTLLIVVLAALTAAASRNRVVGVLRVLGMNARQLRSLVAWEFSPVALGAIVVGTGVGLALPYLVTSVLDLRGFLGGRVAPAPVLDALTIALVVVTFVVVVAAAATLATAAGRRLAPAGVLKMGEE